MDLADAGLNFFAGEQGNSAKYFVFDAAGDTIKGDIIIEGFDMDKVIGDGAIGAVVTGGFGWIREGLMAEETIHEKTDKVLTKRLMN
jgi:hypothetical protein